MSRKESDLSGLLTKKSERLLIYAARDKSKDTVRNSTMYTETICITAEILSPENE